METRLGEDGRAEGSSSSSWPEPESPPPPSAGWSSAPTSEEFFRQHYKKLTDEDKKRSSPASRGDAGPTGVRPASAIRRSIEGVEFAYALNLSVVQRQPALRGGLRPGEQPARRPGDSLHPGDGDGAGVPRLRGRHRRLRRRRRCPARDKFYMPVQCHQCDNPPCVKACPVERHLEGAGRHRRHRLQLVHRLPLLHGGLPLLRPPLQLEPSRPIPPDADQPEPGLPLATARATRAWWRSAPSACTARATGRMPACLEACPTGARKFGNLLDPESEIRYIIETKRVFVLKEELGDRCRGSTTSTALRRRRHDAPRCFRFIEATPAADAPRRTAATDLWVAFLPRLDAGSASLAYLHQLADGLVGHRHGRPGALGRLHRQLHLPGGHGGGRGDAGHPRLHLPRPTRCTRW